MLIAILSLALGVATPAEMVSDQSDNVEQISLAPEMRWALVNGLRYRLGGPFVIANLEDAGTTCSATGNCISVDDLRSNENVRSLGSVESLGEILNQAAVGGNPPVALVALRTGRRVAKGLAVTLSVYDAGTGQWSLKDAVIGQESALNNMPGQIRVTHFRDSVRRK
jgi:hypothetical protein